MGCEWNIHRLILLLQRESYVSLQGLFVNPRNIVRVFCNKKIVSYDFWRVLLCSFMSWRSVTVLHSNAEAVGFTHLEVNGFHLWWNGHFTSLVKQISFMKKKNWKFSVWKRRLIYSFTCQIFIDSPLTMETILNVTSKKHLCLSRVYVESKSTGG